MKTLYQIPVQHFTKLFMLVAIILISTTNAHAQDRIVIKGPYPSNTQDVNAPAYAVLIASDGDEMPIRIKRNGQYLVNAPCIRYILDPVLTIWTGTKEIVVDGRNAKNKKYGERKVKFDITLHGEHPVHTMRYNGPVVEKSFAKGTGTMQRVERYELVPVSSFTAQEF